MTAPSDLKEVAFRNSQNPGCRTLSPRHFPQRDTRRGQPE